MKESEIRLESMRLAAGYCAMYPTADLMVMAERIYAFITASDKQPPVKSAA